MYKFTREVRPVRKRLPEDNEWRPKVYYPPKGGTIYQVSADNLMKMLARSGTTLGPLFSARYFAQGRKRG